MNMPMDDMFGPPPLENNVLKDGIVDRRPVRTPWDTKGQQPSEFYVEGYNEATESED
jgi:hypothetical protein